jgi:hypothetical protein
MAKLRPVRIVVLAFYCFFLALFFLSATANTLFGNNNAVSASDTAWLAATVYISLAVLSVIVGIGILYYSQLCWKILFFSLIITITTMASLVFDGLILFFWNIKVFYQYYQDIQLTGAMWYSFVFIFTSGTIVLYFLTREETLVHFGEMGHLIEPF